MDENEDISKLSDDEIRAERVKTYAGSPKDMGLISELSYRQLAKLTSVIDKFSRNSDIYSRRLICLTWCLIILTIILAIPTVIEFTKWICNFLSK